MCSTPCDFFLRQGDFNGSPNVYQNKMMKGMRFRILLDRHMVLDPTTEWQPLSSGGFQITIDGWQIQPETIIVVQFY